MKCQGNFKFKGLIHRDAGVFTTEQGEVINYKECYLLKLDELTDRGVQERSFKIPMGSSILTDFNGLKLYDDIIVEFDVVLYNSRAIVNPVSVSSSVE